MRYENFDIRVMTAGEGRLFLVASGPRNVGEVRAETEPVFSQARGGRAVAVLEATVGRSRDLVVEGGDGVHRRSGHLPAVAGGALHRTLFPEPVRQLWERSRGRVTDAGLRLRLFFDPRDRNTGWFAAQPWELLCTGPVPEPMYLTLDRGLSIVRYLELPGGTRVPKPATRLRVLALAAAPTDGLLLDLAEEQRRLEDAWGEAGQPAALRFVEHTTSKGLQAELSRGRYDVVHYLGHADFRSESGAGQLRLEGQDGASERLSGGVLGNWLSGPEGPRLVVLNACRTGAGLAGARAYGGIGAELLRRGVPSVVAMQVRISDRAAIAFASGLHRKLAAGGAIDEAVTEGRLAMHAVDPDGVDWAVPVLFSRESAAEAERPEEVVAPGPPGSSLKAGKVEAGRDVRWRPREAGSKEEVDSIRAGRDVDMNYRG